MVAYGRFYPLGYIGLEKATLRLARARSPDTWAASTMLPNEPEVWEQFGVSLNAEVADYCLFSELGIPHKQMPPATFNRYLSFLDAQQELRQLLFAGKIMGEFIDETGKWGYLFSDGWGGDEGDTIIGCGTVWVNDGPLYSVARLVLLNERRLDELIADVRTIGAPPCRGMDADNLNRQRYALINTQHPQGGGEQDATLGKSGTPIARKRGPKEKYNWADFELELRRKLEFEGGIAPHLDPGPDGFKQSNLEDHMRDWCEAAWGVVPGESTIRAKVSTVLKALD